MPTDEDVDAARRVLEMMEERAALRAGDNGDNGDGDNGTGDDGYDLTPLDWPALLRDGVPEVEYISEPYLPRARPHLGVGPDRLDEVAVVRARGREPVA